MTADLMIAIDLGDLWEIHSHILVLENNDCKRATITKGQKVGYIPRNGLKSGGTFVLPVGRYRI